MKLAVLAPLALGTALYAAPAHAQAPGAYYGDGGGYGDPGLAPPGMVPEAAPLPPPPPPLRRFSVGLGFGHAGLAPHSAPDNETNFGIGIIAIRYLAGRHLELELQLAGGQSQNADGTDGDVALGEAVLGLRWRFSPQRRWNWWVMAGMGTLSAAKDGLSQAEYDALNQSTLQFGLGLERRWERFAIQAELRAVGVAKNKDEMSTTTSITGTVADGKKGGQLGVTANYYF